VTKLLGVYHDNPDITEDAKLRSSACLTVPSGTKVEGEVGLMAIPGGTFVVARAEVSASQFGEAWNALMRDWLPESGYQPDDRMCYEVYLNDPKTHPEGKFLIEICQPIRPL
jgi:AraC family transcriptional regulator